MIALSAVTAGELGLTDITVQHYDYLGNLVWTDFFGAVVCGTTTALSISLPGPTIIRGNIYGTVIKISGQVGNSGFLNGVFGTAGFTASSVSYKLYVLPGSNGDPDPKISNGTAVLNPPNATTPGGLLAYFINETLAGGQSTTINCMVPYTGPAVLNLQAQSATATAANVLVLIAHWSVVNTASQISRMVFEPTALSQGEAFSINLPACLNTIEVTNTNATQGFTINIEVIANRTG
jgi:hypothetical protein